MKPEERSAKLLERLATSRFASRASEVVSVVEGKTQLHYGTPVEVRAAAGKKSPNGKDFHVRIAASTESIARDSGVIPIAAWAKGGLLNFVKNPIILAFHDHTQPIGISVHTEITGDNELVEYWQFHEESDVSKLMKTLYEKGFMRAASVGFIVHDWKFIDELDEKEYAALEKVYGTATKDIYWIAIRAELLETSAVPVPSDPNALEFSFAARNAEAIGIDLTPLSPFTERSREMSTPAKSRDAAEVDSTTAATPAAAPAATADTPLDRAAVSEIVTKALEALDAKFEARFAALEAARATPSTSTPAGGAASTEIRGTDEIEIEVRNGETAEQAIERTVSEVAAKLKGAPASTKTK